MNSAKKSGNKGEAKVADLLMCKGYMIVCKNFHSRYGEIDIIAENDKYIVFVEVKTRIQNALVSAVEAVNKQKQIKILKTALAYLAKFDVNKQPRFDVAEVELDSSGNVTKVVHLENAFVGDDYDSLF